MNIPPISALVTDLGTGHCTFDLKDILISIQ